MARLKTQLPARPDRISILGAKFTIVYPAKIKDSGEGDEIYGETDDTSRTIKISSSLNPDDETFERTLLHETIHAILGIAGQDQHLSPVQEEGIVKALENGLFSLYRRRL